MLIHNSNNGDNDLLELQQAKVKLENAKKSKEVLALQKLIEPLTEAIEELTEVIQEVKDAANVKPEPIEPTEPPEYFDKDLSQNLTSSIDKVFGLLQNIKQPKLDLSPITSIISEIKNQNASLINLINNLSKNGNETLVKEALGMIQKSNEFISKGLNQTDYSKEIKEVSTSIEKNKPVEWEFNVIRSQYGNLIERVIAVPKLKK